MNTTRADLIAMAETLRRAHGHLMAAVNDPCADAQRYEVAARFARGHVRRVVDCAQRRATSEESRYGHE